MSDGIEAASVRLELCAEDCPCQSVHILLVDADDDVFGSATFGADWARAIAHDLNRLADIADAQRAKNEGRLQ